MEREREGEERERERERTLCDMQDCFQVEQKDC